MQPELWIWKSRFKKKIMRFWARVNWFEYEWEISWRWIYCSSTQIWFWCGIFCQKIKSWLFQVHIEIENELSAPEVIDIQHIFGIIESMTAIFSWIFQILSKILITNEYDSSEKILTSLDGCNSVPAHLETQNVN